jgi:DNA-binding MarR family transcriptional regulator
MQRFRHEEMRSLKESLLEFKTRTDAALSQLIARAQGSYGIPNAPSRLNPPGAAEDVSFVGYIDEECRRARLRDRIFGACSLNQAAWMLLLLIGKAELTGMRLTIKAAAYSAGMPLSSALRKINELCSSGLLARQEDPADARRSFVTLTSGGRSFLTQYLSEYSEPRERPAER